MIRPKYKKMYKEQCSNYNELLNWISYFMEILQNKKIIEYKVIPSDFSFEDKISIKTINNGKPLYITFGLWDTELANRLKKGDKE